MSAKFASRKNPEQRSVDSSLTLSEGRGGDGVRTGGGNRDSGGTAKHPKHQSLNPSKVGSLKSFGGKVCCCVAFWGFHAWRKCS